MDFHNKHKQISYFDRGFSALILFIFLLPAFSQWHWSQMYSSHHSGVKINRDYHYLAVRHHG